MLLACLLENIDFSFEKAFVEWCAICQRLATFEEGLQIFQFDFGFLMYSHFDSLRFFLVEFAGIGETGPFEI